MKKTLFEELKRDLNYRKIGFRQVVAVTILSMIVLVFVFFGYSAKDSMGIGAVAQINSTVISSAEYQRELSRMEQMYAPFLKQMGGGKQQRDFVRTQALDNIINQEVAYQASQGLGIHVSKQEIVKVITQEVTAFQEDGRFQRDRYEGLLRANQWTPAEFEKQIRKEKATKRLQFLSELAMVPSELEIKKEASLSDKQKSVEFISWDSSEWAKSVAVTQAQLKVQLKDSEFSEKVKNEFELKKQSLGQPEQVRARHILVKADPSDEASAKQALAKAKIIQDLLKTKDFAALAKEYSEDEGSKSKGGDLDFFTRGTMVSEFEEYAFSAELNAVSEPIKSQFGYHLIEVTDKKPAQEARLEDHELSLAQEVWGREQYESEVKKLEASLLARDTKEIETLIKSWKMKWQESGFFSLADESAGALTSAVATERAWELSANQPYLSELVRDGGRVYLMRFKAEQTKAKAQTVDGESGTSVDPAKSLAQSKSGELIGRFLQEHKDRSKIIKSPQILRN